MSHLMDVGKIFIIPHDAKQSNTFDFFEQCNTLKTLQSPMGEKLCWISAWMWFG